MLRSVTVVLALPALCCLGCESSAAPSPEPAAAAAPAPPAPGAAVRRYGAPIAPGPTVALAQVMAQPEKYAGQDVLLAADVRRACQRKGCWMELADPAAPEGPACRVTFKDYGFFVPTDAAGSHARVKGNVVVQTVAAAQVQHMEEEGASFTRKNADGSATEVRLVATGVELQR